MLRGTLVQLGGPTVPEWCGVGDPGEGCYAGLSGKAFARVLEELWTEVTLLFRRTFYDLMRQKAWDVPDIVMEETRATVSRP